MFYFDHLTVSLFTGCCSIAHPIAQIPLGSSRRHVSTRSTCRAHAFSLCRACQIARLDTLASTRSTRRTCCVVSRRDEPSEIWAYHNCQLLWIQVQLPLHRPKIFSEFLGQFFGKTNETSSKELCLKATCVILATKTTQVR